MPDGGRAIVEKKEAKSWSIIMVTVVYHYFCHQVNILPSMTHYLLLSSNEVSVSPDIIPLQLRQLVSKPSYTHTPHLTPFFFVD